MKNRFIAVLALVLLAFASVSMAAENLPQSEVDEIVKGVESGDAEAQFRLGMMYYNGQNVKQDEEQAQYWLNKASQQGNENAKKALAEIRAKKIMTDDDFIELCKSYEPQSEKVLEAINNGANVNAKDDGEITALMYVLLRGHSTDVINAFIKAGADVNAKDNAGGTPLMKAPRSTNPANITPLIKAGAEVNLKNDWGYTALIWAAKEGNPESVNLLLDAGAVVTIRDDEGKTALDYARENKNLTGTNALRRLENLSVASQGQKSQSKSNADSVMEIDFEQALKESRGNGLVYKRKYDGKKVRVSGKITAIDTEIFENKPFVCLVNKENNVVDVSKALYCYFENSEADSVMELTTGQWVTIEGTCTENLLFTFVLVNSRVVNAPQPTSQASAPSVRTESTGTKTSAVSTQTQPSVSSLSKPRNFDEAKGNAAAFLASVEDVAEKLMNTESYKTQDSENNGDENLYMRSWYNDRYFMFCYYANSRPRPVASFRTYSPEFTFAGGIKVGTSFNAIRDLFGDFGSWSAKDNTLNINVDTGEANIHVTDGRIDYIEYNHLLAEYTHKMSNLLCLYRGDIYSAGITAKGRLNVRSAPGTHGMVLFQVENQNNLLFVDKSSSAYDNDGNRWYRVRFVQNYDSNTIGSVNEAYVMGKYINIKPLTYDERETLTRIF